jgi:hypothetical protein
MTAYIFSNTLSITDEEPLLKNTKKSLLKLLYVVALEASFCKIEFQQINNSLGDSNQNNPLVYRSCSYTLQ